MSKDKNFLCHMILQVNSPPFFKQKAYIFALWRNNMNLCKLKIGIAFSMLAIAVMPNILSYAIDENYVAFGKHSEESHGGERAWEEKNPGKNTESHGGEKLAIITFDDN